MAKLSFFASNESTLRDRPLGNVIVLFQVGEAVPPRKSNWRINECLLSGDTGCNLKDYGKKYRDDYEICC